MIAGIIWIALCFVVATIGSGKNIGYWGVFFISLFFSPLIGLIFALASSPVPVPAPVYKCKFCGFTTNVQSHFCPACDKDNLGKTKDDYKNASSTKS